jgi:hypothetical protein
MESAKSLGGANITYRSGWDSLSNFDICLQDRNTQNKLPEEHRITRKWV